MVNGPEPESAWTSPAFCTSETSVEKSGLAAASWRIDCVGAGAFARDGGTRVENCGFDAATRTMFLSFMPVRCGDEAVALPLIATTEPAATTSAVSDFFMLGLSFLLIGWMGYAASSTTRRSVGADCSCS